MNLSKNKAKWITSLQIKKFRQKYNKFLAEGDKIVVELLRDLRWKVEEIYALPEWILQHADLLMLRPGLSVEPVSEQELQRISSMNAPQQVLAVVEKQVLPREPQIIEADFSLYLDGIQDPGNLGAILRIADWFGIRHVFLSPETAEVFNPKVVQASMGAFLRICAEVCALEELKRTFPGLRVWGADLAGTDVFELPRVTGGLLLVIGNEGAGISFSCRALLDQTLTIPRHPQGGAESLNAAVATGILAAALRQRL